MRSFLSYLLALSICSLFGLQSRAQPDFFASIKPQHITTDEFTTLRFVLKDARDLKNFTPPSLDEFDVVSGPNQETSMSSINGTVSQYTALSYIIRPRKAGKFSIGAASAVSGNKMVKSNPVMLIVDKGKGKTNNSQPASPLSNFFSYNDPDPEPEKSVDLDDYILHKGENIAAKVDRNMALRLETNKTECYVGEPIIANYKFYTRLKSESKLSKNPSFNGFSVIDLLQPDATLSSIGKLNGKEYNIYTIRKAQLYPLQPGNITLESATIENEIQFLREEKANKSSFLRDLRNGFPLSPDALITQHVTLSSKPVSILVKPLPLVGKPASFHDAVGRFTIEAVTTKNNFTTDETGTFKLTISGSGNMHLITAPEIAWPAGIDGFEPTLEDNIDKTQVPITGSKTFTYNFTASAAGSYTLPAISFSYFDPYTAEYKSLQSNPQKITISKGSNLKAPVTIATKKEKPSELLQFLSHNWVWLLFFSGLSLLVLTQVKKKSKNENVPIKPEIAPAISKTIDTEAVAEKNILNQLNPLSETEMCLARNDCNNFYRILNLELRNFLGSKFNIAPSLINKNNLEVMLDNCQIETPIAIELGQLLEEIEWNLYSPVSPGEQIQGIYKRSVHVVQTINEGCREIKN